MREEEEEEEEKEDQGVKGEWWEKSSEGGEVEDLENETGVKDRGSLFSIVFYPTLFYFALPFKRFWTVISLRCGDHE